MIRVLIACTILALALAVFVLRVSREMPDFEVYWTGATRAAAAEPLYRAEDQHYQFKYLPAFAVLTIPLGFLPLAVAKGVWFVGSVALLVALITMSVRLLPQQRKPPGLLAVIAIVVLGKFYARELLLGQVNLLFAVIATGALLAMKVKRESLAGSLVATTIAIKPYGILLVPWLVARRRVASAAAACFGVVVVYLLPSTLYGLEGDIALHRAWWQAIRETTAPNLLNPDNVSLASLYAKWLGRGELATLLAVITACALLALAAVVFFRRRGITFPEGLEGSLLLILIPLLSPQGWDYVLLVATPAIMYLANYEDRLPPALRVLAILAALTIGLSLFDLMGRAAYVSFMETGIITLCLLVLIAALCALRVKKVA